MTDTRGSRVNSPHELARVAVQLVIYSENLSPEGIAAHLNLQPTRTTEKGVKVGARTGTSVVVPRHLWEISTEFQVATRDFQCHLDWLLSKLQPVREQLRAIRDDPKNRCSMVAVIWTNGDIAHVQLAANHLRALVDLQLSIEFEFADYGEDQFRTGHSSSTPTTTPTG